MGYESAYSETGWGGVRPQTRGQTRSQTRAQTRAQTGETGFIADAIKAGGQAMDILAGGPQKRERAAKAERDAEALRLQTAALELEAMKLQQSAPPPSTYTPVTVTKQQPSFLTAKTAGLPNWGWGVAGLVVAGGLYFALKD